jgi:hypothetical protein
MELPRSTKAVNNLYPVIVLDNDITIADIWSCYHIVNEYKKQTSMFDIYHISDGEDWYEIADNLYSDRELWWLLPLFNGIDDPFRIQYDRRVDNSINKIIYMGEEHVNRFLSIIRRKLRES